ncbi:MAG: DUF3429 domain-containing protein [Steroidobacteraceae bacterium]|jgi:hypothetical protein|nr:DUF3429 domain-containing protein [Steroidobacteraceae bacterium]
MSTDAREAQLPPGMQALGFGGLIPFIAAMLAVVLLPDAEARELARRILVGYGAVILSFLGGVHWGLVLRDRPADGFRPLVMGVLPSLAGLATLLLPFDQAVAVQVACFGGFWLYEHRVLGPAVLPSGYLALRRWLTLIVCAALALALMAPTLRAGG